MASNSRLERMNFKWIERTKTNDILYESHQEPKFLRSLWRFFFSVEVFFLLDSVSHRLGSQSAVGKTLGMWSNPLASAVVSMCSFVVEQLQHEKCLSVLSLISLAAQTSSKRFSDATITLYCSSSATDKNLCFFSSLNTSELCFARHQHKIHKH